MDYQTFTFDAQLWMKDVCHELFDADVFSSLCEFELLYDKDFGDNYVVGFSILSYYTLSMGDSVIMNKICEKHECFYRVCPTNDCLSIVFYLESHG